jgi:hypothetical protein
VLSEAVVSSPTDVYGAAEALRQVLALFDPELATGADCALVAEELARTEKACAGARAWSAARAIRTSQHRARGFADGADWAANRMGSAVGVARAELEAAAAMKNLAATQAAVAAGEVSLAQAAQVARAEAAVAGSEEALLDLARRSGLGPVREEARRIVLGATDPKETAKRHHRARSFRHWRDDDGMVRMAGALAPEVGIGLMNRIDAEANRLRRAAGADREAFEAHAADALVRMLDGTGTQRSSRTDVNVVIDLSAYRRGHAHPGEACHIVGGGPVTVDWVRQVMADAFVKAVLHDGVRIRNVAHFGRHMKAELRTALELGAPPRFDGVKCSAPGCERRYGLEWDHVDPVAHDGPTSYDNLQGLCKPHHWEKTERDRQAGLHGPRAP